MKKKTLEEILEKTNHVNEEIKLLLQQAGYERGSHVLELEYDTKDADKLRLTEELLKIMCLLELASYSIDCLNEDNTP
ncbi:MAG: hypothetical protein IJN92_08625 [Lachnospiraceae bacterium]|nr:hypothetical protein [Lachnospiraceae bacterium]